MLNNLPETLRQQWKGDVREAMGAMQAVARTTETELEALRAFVGAREGLRWSVAGFIALVLGIMVGRSRTFSR